MGCECVSVRIGDLRERKRERRSWCDEKLNDPSATLCIFAGAQTNTGLVKADGTVPRRSGQQSTTCTL